MGGIIEESESLPTSTSSDSQKSSVEDNRTLRDILEQELIQPHRLGMADSLLIAFTGCPKKVTFLMLPEPRNYR